MNVKRFSLITDHTGCCMTSDIKEDPDGEYVLATDYHSIWAELQTYKLAYAAMAKALEKP